MYVRGTKAPKDPEAMSACELTYKKANTDFAAIKTNKLQIVQL
jgi:hypothetical protein